jgi:hypothetical protein
MKGEEKKGGDIGGVSIGEDSSQKPGKKEREWERRKASR